MFASKHKKTAFLCHLLTCSQFTIKMSTQQRIEFSSRWEVNRFVSVLSDKSNHIVPPFIVSPNISPFSRRLLDAYIELSVDDFSAQSSWSKISTFVNFKSYFCQPISVSFNITFRGPHYQDKITSYGKIFSTTKQWNSFKKINSKHFKPNRTSSDAAQVWAHWPGKSVTAIKREPGRFQRHQSICSGKTWYNL